jgi:hypothetical protein
MLDWQLNVGKDVAGFGRCFVDLDYAGSLDNNTLTTGLVFIVGDAVHCTSRMQQSTPQSPINAGWYAFGVGGVRLKQQSQLLNMQGILPIRPILSHLQSLIPCVKHRIHYATAGIHIAAKYYYAADMAGNGEIHLSYVPTAEMVSNSFPRLLVKHTVLKWHGALGMIDIRLPNNLDIEISDDI